MLWKVAQIFQKFLGATSIEKIGEVRLSDEIGGGGVWSFEKAELYDYY